MALLETLRERRLLVTLVGALLVGTVAGTLQTAGFGPATALVVSLALLVPIANLTTTALDVDSYLDDHDRGRVALDALLSAGAALLAGFGTVTVLGDTVTALTIAVPAAVTFLAGSMLFFARNRRYAAAA